MPPKTDRTFNLLIGLVLLAIATRALGASFLNAFPQRWLAAGLLALFAVFLAAAAARLTRTSPQRLPYLTLQSGLILGLLALRPFLDFYAVLFALLSIQAILLYDRRLGFRWVAVFIGLTAVSLVIGSGPLDAVGLTLLYAALFVTVAYLVTLRLQSESAQQESEFLLTELQEAHARLQEQAAQAEELAVMKERNRLARDLHDSVTQALYSQTMLAEAAARQLEAGDREEALAHLRDLRATSEQALREMRLLIFELRPPALEKEGLATALRARLEAVEHRTGLKAEIRVEGEVRLPPHVEEGVYWISQEALNNVLKHARARSVSVVLSQAGQKFSMVIQDDGVGFKPGQRAPGGMGLPGMEERASQFSGRLVLDSKPGEGTVLSLEVPL